MNGVKKRILVIDDQELFLKAIAMELRSLGYRVKTALNALDGMESLLRETFDLVIVDMMMPEIGGLVAIQAIRREHPDLPILAISGYYDKLQDVLHEAKVDAILPKPIRLGNLEHTLSTVLSEKSRSNGKSLETLQSRGASRHVRESSRQ